MPAKSFDQEAAGAEISAQMERLLEGPGVSGEAPAAEKSTANQGFGRIPGGRRPWRGSEDHARRAAPKLLEYLGEIEVLA
ncbi:MAG: hypothetical protein LBU32_13445 [Clostridiales bacterium]|nr:hypothetical protein [Clostridiales bacterium]